MESLILVAEARAEEVRRTVDELGVEHVAAVLVGEIEARCQAPKFRKPVRLQLDILHDSRTVSHVLTFASTGLSVTTDTGAPVVAQLRFAAADLVACLYGTTVDRATLGQHVDVNWANTENNVMELLIVAPKLVEAVLATCVPATADLSQLAVRFGSDKWGSLHWYTPHYERYLSRFRNRPIRILEIGIGGYQDPGGGGGSLRVWQEYFRRATVYGLDIFPKDNVRGPRIRTLQGDQNDAGFMAELAAEHGPFDIVIDDGSHVNEHVLTSFHALFPHVRTGGIYVIEDLQTSYWPEYGGQPQDPTTSTSSVGFLKTLIDGLNHREYEHESGERPSYADQHVVGLHFHHNLAFIEKGDNLELPSPSWLPRAPMP